MNKHTFIALLMTCFSLHTAAQQQLNMSLLYSWTDLSIPASQYGRFNDCWGYVDSAGREYAIMGSSKGTHFFDITDPGNTAYVSFQPSKDTVTAVIHRDFKTYQHYCYAVADQGSNSLQIFDLQYLPDSVVKVYDSDVLCKRAHNIFIEGDKLYLASNAVGFGFSAMDVLSLADPINPTFISSLSSPLFNHVHDVFVKNDTAYCSVGFQGFYVYSYVNPFSPQPLMSLTSYPDQGYNHSSWLTPDGSHVVMADENHGLGLKLIDISDFTNPVVASVFRSNLLNVPNPTSSSGSVAHNEFIIGNLLYVSYYHDGVQVFDISDPTNPVIIAYYDTHPQSTTYNSYQGCWGVYPFLPSGNIIASDLNNGLFILDGSAITGNHLPSNPKMLAKPWPNPFSEQVVVPLNGIKGTINIHIDDLCGRRVYSDSFDVTEQTSFTIPTNYFPNGMYALTVIWTDGQMVSKVMKVGNF